MLNKSHLIIIALLYLNVEAWPKFTVKVLNISYDHSDDYLDLNATLSSSGSISAYVRTLAEIKELFLSAVLKFSTNNSNNLDVNFTNKTIDVCKLLHNPRYEPLLRIGYKIIAQKAHLPQQCPLQKNDLFYAANYTFETDQFPPVIPSTIMFFDVMLSVINNDQLYRISDFKLIAQVIRN